MNVMMLASNVFWVPVCIFAIALIIWDIKNPKTKRFVIAFAVASSLASVHLFAQDYTWDACQACNTITEWALWIVAGCFLC